MLVDPGRIERDFGLLRIQDLEHLGLDRFWRFRDLLARQRRPCGVLSGGIADHAGEVTDQKDDLMAEILELTHLVDQNRMAQDADRAPSDRTRP